MSRTSISKSNQKDSLLISQAWILSLTAFLAPLIGGKLNPFGSGILRILVLITGMLFILRGIRETSGVRTNAVFWLSLILFALGLLSLTSSVSIHETLFALLDLGAYLLILLIIANLPDQGSVIRILGSLLASAFIVSALGFREYLLSAKPDWRTFATFFNPDFLAGFMAIVLPLTLAWYLSPSPVGISIASGLAFLGILGTLILSGSRLGALCAIGGVIIFALFTLISRSFKKHQAVRLAVLIVPMLLVVIFLSTPLTSRVASVQSESHSAAFRFETWKGTIRVAKAHPISGTGLGTFQLIYPKYAHVGFTKMAHNSYLQLASESGIAAPIILVLLIGCASLYPISALLKRQMRREPADDDWTPNRQLILCGIIGGVAASAARNIVDSDWYISAIGYSFATLLGAGIALAFESPASKVPIKRLTAITLSGFLAIAIIVSLLAVTAYQFQLSGDSLTKKGDLDKAIYAYHIAARLDYLNSENLRALGQVYATRAS
ncbi:MAG: O-antigen ligase family protein, partial [Armatimonadota bacterium]|nr:O-antigen ligase family protein [Armatimonadota bacterium]